MNKELLAKRRTELKSISIILDRAEALKLNTSRVSLMLDIEHSNVDVNQLATADDVTFNHDVIGIFNHFDRQTKTMTGCFVPRVGFKK